MSDDRYVELARALDEDGDPGVGLLTGLYPSVAAIVAERDRLRAIVDATMVSLGDDAPASPDFLPEYAGMLLREHNQLGAAHDAAVQAVTTGLAERDRLRAVVGAAETLVSELDANPIGEYGDAVCEAIDQLDAALKATKEGT